MNNLTKESFWDVFDRTMKEAEAKVGYEYYRDKGKTKAKVLTSKDQTYKTTKGKESAWAKVSSSRPPRAGLESKEVKAIAKILKSRNEFDKVSSKDDNMPDVVGKANGDQNVYFDGNNNPSKPDDVIKSSTVDRVMDEEKVMSHYENPKAYFVRTNDEYNPNIDYFVAVMEDDEDSSDLVAILVDQFNSCCLFETKGDGVFWAKQAGLREGDYDVIPFEGELDIDESIPNSMPLKAPTDLSEGKLEESEVTRARRKIKPILEQASAALQKYVDKKGIKTKYQPEVLAIFARIPSDQEKVRNKKVVATLVLLSSDEIDTDLKKGLKFVGYLIQCITVGKAPSIETNADFLDYLSKSKVVYDVRQDDEDHSDGFESNMVELAIGFLDKLTSSVGAFEPDDVVYDDYHNEWYELSSYGLREARAAKVAKRCLKEAETSKKPGKLNVVPKDKIKEALESAEKRFEEYVDLCTEADYGLRPKWALVNVVCARQSTDEDKSECKYYNGEKNGIVTLVTIPYDRVDELLTDDLVPVGFLIEYFAQEGDPSIEFDKIVKENGGFPMLRKYDPLPIAYDVDIRDHMPGSSHEENMKMLAWKFIDSYTDIEDPMELIEDKDDNPVIIDDNWDDVINLYD